MFGSNKIPSAENRFVEEPLHSQRHDRLSHDEFTHAPFLNKMSPRAFEETEFVTEAGHEFALLDWDLAAGAPPKKEAPPQIEELPAV